MLTEQQVKHFHTLGFLVFRQLFTEDELRTIRAEFETAMEAAYRHAPFDGTHRHWLPMMGPETPFFANLPEDPRFSEVAEQLYGDDVFFVVSDANRYVGNTSWHPDHNADPTQDCYGVKFAYYLEPVDAESGALRLIPGSHKRSLHDDLRENLNALGLEICDVPGYVCKSDPGDVVAFDMRCWHASWGVMMTAVCVRWFITTTPKRLKKRLPPVIGHAAMPELQNTSIDRVPHSTIHIGLKIRWAMKNDNVGLIGCTRWDSWIAFKINNVLQEQIPS